MTIYDGIYSRLLALIPDLGTMKMGQARKSIVNGYMDLYLDILYRSENKITIALSHYYKSPCGDMVADPDMTIRVYCDIGMAEALSYQDTFGYKEVYQGNMVAPKRKKELNEFLNIWLKNCASQGHMLLKREDGE